jgi:hypothetical protein
MPLESRKSALSCDLSTLTATGDAEIRYMSILKAVLLIRDVYPGPNLSIPDPGSKKNRIPDLDPQEYLSIFNPKFFY